MRQDMRPRSRKTRFSQTALSVVSNRIEAARNNDRRRDLELLVRESGRIELDRAVYRLPLEGHAIQIDEHVFSPLVAAGL